MKNHYIETHDGFVYEIDNLNQYYADVKNSNVDLQHRSIFLSPSLIMDHCCIDVKGIRKKWAEK